MGDYSRPSLHLQTQSAPCWSKFQSLAQSGEGSGTIMTGCKILGCTTTGTAGVTTMGIPSIVLIALIHKSPSASAV